MKVLRLRDPSGVFIDPDTGFSLVKDEVKPKPDRIGHTTEKWLISGGIIEAEDEKPLQAAARSDEEVSSFPSSSEPTPQKRKYSEKDLNSIPISELKELAKLLGIEVRKTDNHASLIKKIREKQ